MGSNCREVTLNFCKQKFSLLRYQTSNSIEPSQARASISDVSLSENNICKVKQGFTCKPRLPPRGGEAVAHIDRRRIAHCTACAVCDLMRGYSLCLRRQARFHANEVSISSFASKRFNADLSAFHCSRCEPCPSSDLSINAQATFPRGGRLRFSLTRKMDFIFPFSKAKDIRGRLRVRATARTLTEGEKIKVKNPLS